MQIVHIPRRFVRDEWGGTETVVLETARRQIAAGHQATIMCPSMLSSPGPDEMAGVPIVRVPYFYPYFGLSAEARQQLDKKGGNVFSFALLRALERMPDLDLIHLHTGKRLGGIARKVAQHRRIPYVISLHGGLFDVPGGEVDSWTSPSAGAWEWGKALGMWVGSRRVMDDAGAIICVGEQERSEVSSRYPHKRVAYLPNGVDAQRFGRGDGQAFRAKHSIPPTARVILCVGRIDPQKNQLLVLLALSGLRNAIPDVHLVCLGPVTNDAYYQRLLVTCRDLGCENAVTLLTGVPNDSHDLVDAYHAADVFVLSSVHEPFGIVILEAWAAGLPVVASRVGGVPTLVTDDSDGLLFDSDDIDALAKQVLAVLQSPNLQASLRDRARATVRGHYTWEAVTGRMSALYEDVRCEYSVR